MKPRWLLLAYALFNVILYSMLLPLWEGFDEPFHFGYVQNLANRRGLPDPRSSKLSQEVGSSLLLAPASLAVQTNLPEVTSYPEFFSWPESRRQQVHRQLYRIDPALRWQPSGFVNYEAHHAPLAFAALALPERALAKLPLPSRVLALRILAGALGALLLVTGAERLAAQVGIRDPHKDVLIFCALSSQMTWATLAHVANDWLAVPLTIWLLVMLIHYDEAPQPRRAVLASVVLSLGLLTKAYFIAFIPVMASVCILRRRWRDLGISLLIVLALAGPWYMRNVQRYGTISGMQEARAATDATAALGTIRIRELPAAIDSYARSALWTANNTFRTFSSHTLTAVIAVWLAAVLLWVTTRRKRAEGLLVLYAGVFILALAYDTALAFVYTHGQATSPSPWYTQVLLVPVLTLGLLGTSRRERAGKVVAGLMALLFGYVLVVTYWVKLIPLYSGFEGRTSLASMAALYGKRLPALMTGLNDVCLAPAAMILFLSGAVTVLVAWQEVILIRRLFAAPAPSPPPGGSSNFR